MTTSTLPARYKINGLLDTKRQVMDNLESICNACGTFMTYDIHEGQWGVVINKADTAVKTFDDSNIVGPIQVQGTSVLNLYNKVRVEYNLRDTADGTDFIEIEIPDADRYQNEPDNVLQIRLDMCNEPVQAEIIGLIELKQARIDQIITFQSDYSTLNLNAGDIIAVTNDLYQFTAKPFRVITLKEIDADDGSIRIEITALAYDSNVYDTSDLGRYIRSDRNGIKGIGSIGQPIAPVLYPYDLDVRPRIVVESTVPDGIVESMELWLSSDNSTYSLIATEYPPGGGTFTAGDTVTFDYDQVSSQNLYVKVRGMNSTTTGPFSTSDSFLSYVPVQTTAAISDNTDVVDSAGSSLLGLLGSNALIALIKKLVEDNDAAAGGIYDQVFNTFDMETGQNLIQAQNASMMWVQAGTFEDDTGPYTPAQTFTTPNRPCYANGQSIYVIATINFGYDSASVVDTFKAVSMNIYQNNTLIATRENGSAFQDAYDDFTLSCNAIGTFAYGDNIKVSFEVESDTATGILIDYMVFQPFASSLA